jgi:hypothetical protein
MLHLNIESGYKVSGPGLRRVINYLRQMNFPIISGKWGYSYTNKMEDIDMTIEQLESRVISIKQAIDGLKKSKKVIEVDFI